jgi:hypothetical protein
MARKQYLDGKVDGADEGRSSRQSRICAMHHIVRGPTSDPWDQTCRGFENEAPIAVKAVAIWREEITVESSSDLLAQYRRTAEVGSPSASTCILSTCIL